LTRDNILVPLSTTKIQRLYNSLSSVYDLVTGYETGSIHTALELANPKGNLTVLDAGFGTGKALVEFAMKVADDGAVYGLDISQKMTEKTRRMLARRHLSHKAQLVLGDAGRVPFNDNSFDLVFSSYMLDLIDTARIPQILSEFRRVLKPAGQLVLVSLSKGSKWYDNMSSYQWLYQRCPTLLGGCRPVALTPFLREQGFEKVSARLIHAWHLMPTEIVWANRPG
jgi:ubiquinone/menaquinone biosynthesis C-methylase UbiE